MRSRIADLFASHTNPLKPDTQGCVYHIVLWVCLAPTRDHCRAYNGYSWFTFYQYCSDELSSVKKGQRVVLTSSLRPGSSTWRQRRSHWGNPVFREGLYSVLQYFLQCLGDIEPGLLLEQSVPGKSTPDRQCFVSIFRPWLSIIWPYCTKGRTRE